MGQEGDVWGDENILQFGYVGSHVNMFKQNRSDYTEEGECYGL